jgi:hypothetical protein
MNADSPTNPRSPSLAGQTFGSYQIKELIGAGGMGEPHRARPDSNSGARRTEWPDVDQPRRELGKLVSRNEPRPDNFVTTSHHAQF